VTNSRDSHTRYKFAPLESGAFFFPTDQGCYFTVAIEEAGFKLWKSDKLSNDDKVFELSFDKTCDEDGETEFDDAICNTIIHIFSSNIASRGDLFVYYHIWEKDEFHSKLYEHWYTDMEAALPDFDAIDYQAKEDEHAAPYITSLFIHKNHPDRDLIDSEFEKAVGNSSKE
jgi:hypothetical protein